MGDICYELAEHLWRPPKVGVVKECFECDWWLRIVLPHCCLPGCNLFPECTFTRTAIVDDGKIDCTLSWEDAFRAWLGGGISLNADFGEAAWVFLRPFTRPLPDAWRNLLDRIANSSLMSGLD